MNKVLVSAKLFFRRNGSTILTCIGGVGVVATSVMAVKATPKALYLLEQAKEEKGEELTIVEKVVVAGPCYIPAIATGAGTIACIFGANVLNRRSQASLASAYALLDRSYKDYRAKAKEILGEEGEVNIRKEIAADKYHDNGIMLNGEDILFYDEFSGRYFEAPVERVHAAEYKVNRELILRDYVSLNEFYEWLGLNPIAGGDILGWSRGGNMAEYWQEWIDFAHHKVTMDDGLECFIISILAEPMEGYGDYC